MPEQAIKIDLSGQRFGRLTALEPCGRKNGHIVWLCRCDCGNFTEVESSELRRTNRNGTKSCGCLAAEKSRLRIANRYPNPHSKERLYNVWTSMLHRCNCENAQHYKDYGGRGIKVCEEWSSYEVFKKWALSHGYDAKAPRGRSTLDRIDVNGNYEPSNCRFVDMKIQVHNRRKAGEF